MFPNQQFQNDPVALAMALLAQAQGQNGQAAYKGGMTMPAYKTVPSSTPTTIYGHGNGGLFSYPGMERPVFSAMQLPLVGLQNLLPVRANNSDNPVYGILTGVTATTGDEPTGPCDDPPVAGLSKLCKHTFVWGRQSRQSRVFELDRFGRIANRSDFRDLQFMGDPFVNPNPNTPTIPGQVGGDSVLNTEMGKALFEMAVAWSRDFAQELYTGNPTNNTASGGRKYFYGLDILINTGYRDAETGTACAAADSIVRSFGDLRVDSNGASLVKNITYIYRNLKYIAEQAGLMPAKWVIAMRWSLFYEITEIWPCAYATYRCQTGVFSTSQPQFTDSATLIRMRDEMRAGQYLLIDGEKVDVVLDNAIAETEPAAGVFESQIYFVPLTVLGGTPVTFIENFNYDAPGAAMDAAKFFAPDGSYYTSDNGRFLWHRKPPTNFCVQILAKTEPRLLLLTPYIAARLTDLRYSPLIHERDAFTDGGYFVNGGGTNRNGLGPSLYSPTA